MTRETTPYHMEDPQRPFKRKRDSVAQPEGDNPPKAAEPRNQPLSKSVEPPAKEEKAASTSELFQPLTQELQRLDEKDPVLATQAARLVALYRRMWESYIAKHADVQRLERENRRLLSTNERLERETKDLEYHYKEQSTRLTDFQKAFQNVREGILGICESWKDAPAELSDGRGDGSALEKHGRPPARPTSSSAAIASQQTQAAPKV